MNGLFKSLRIKRKDASPCDAQVIGKEDVCMKSEFLDGIAFEENPFANEVPDKVIVFDLNGNEVAE